ncbi:MAG: fibronectin type III domain-containing protein [Sideroxydans sp.]|nr:fibronectin type III domain-containing protein [Sideroxydans sp.]
MMNHSLLGLKKLTLGGSALITASALLLGGCGGRGSPTIKATPQTIQFSAAPTLPLSGSATASATASSGLPITYSSNTTTICSVNSSSGLVTSLAVGTCIIAADQAGNDTFAPAPQATQNIAAAFDPNQTISFGAAPALAIYGTAAVSANASSNLPVSFSSTTPAICSVNATTGLVTDLTPGNCIIAANQAGDANYNAAPQTTQTLTVPVWGAAITAPSAPSNVSTTVGNASNIVVVSFNGPSSSGGSPITGYTVTSVPSAYSANGTSSPISVTCTTTCTGEAFTVAATNNIGTGTPSPAAEVLTNYNVTTTFFEPDTQPNDTIFTGSFTFNSSTRTVTNLKGLLTESMTHINDGIPMNTVSLSHQLSAINDGMGGLLVTVFAMNTTNTLTNNPLLGGSNGWAPTSGGGLYFGFPSATNPASGGSGNAYAMIYVNLANPTTALSQAQIDQLSYADCTALGMMGDVCMTATSFSVYGTVGTMSGFPIAQIITKQ